MVLTFNMAALGLTIARHKVTKHGESRNFCALWLLGRARLTAGTALWSHVRLAPAARVVKWNHLGPEYVCTCAVCVGLVDGGVSLVPCYLVES